jgi:uncharacterized protein (DUF169 family)
MNEETQQSLGLSKPPIAIGFLDTAPQGISPWTEGPVPAGCSFWRAAMEGKSFYTVPSDHYNCAVGSYVHAISIPSDRGPALQDTIGFMVGNGYLRMEEVPGIPVLPKTPAYIAYAPVGDAAFKADVVVIAARPASAMLIYEAALRAGAGDALTSTLGRPGCAVLPLSMASGKASLSFGCKGNRTYTGLPDEELYIALPGAKWPEVSDALDPVAQANAAMEARYRAVRAV